MPPPSWMPTLSLLLLVCLNAAVGAAFIVPHHPHHAHHRTRHNPTTTTTSPFSSSLQRPPSSPLLMSTPASDDLRDISKDPSSKGVLLDLSSSGWGLISIKGEDRLRFLHNQLTNSFTEAKAGQVIETSYTTSLGRSIDLLTAYVLEEEVLLLASPSRHEQIVAAFNKYIFPLDRVEVTKKDLPALFTWMGPSSSASSVLAQLLAASASSLLLPGPHQCTHTDTHLLAEGTGLALPGFTLLCLDKDTAASTQTNAAATTNTKIKYIPTATATKEWNALRILQGRPYPDKELTLEITPLEAGLWHTVDFAKGCYLGQETLAKVANNKGERQKLYGFELDRKGGGGKEEGKVEEGMRLVDAAGKRAGAVTSFLPERRVGLAYIRKSVGADPMSASLFLEEKDGGKAQTQIRVVDIPYAVRSATSSSSSSPAAGGVAAGGAGKSDEDAAAAAAATAAAAAEKAAEAERKAQKLAEMQARLAAFQAKQKKG